MNLHSNKPKDSGMVLIFVVAAIFTLVVLLGLFLDVGTMMIAKRDREKTARLVSSEAVTVFNRNTDTDPAIRVSVAKTKSQGLADTNLKLQFAKAFFDNKKEDDQSFGGTSTDSGSLVPGIWYFNQNGVMTKDELGNSICTEASPNNCPCKKGQWNGPCFKPIKGFDSPTDVAKINAFSADLWTRNHNKMKTTFMGVVGQKDVSLRSQSTIAVRPLNVVVLVDLSRFIDEETHVPYEVAGLKGLAGFQYNPAKFAYPLDPIAGPATCNPAETETEVTIDSAAKNSVRPAEITLTCKRSLPINNGNFTPSVCRLKGGNHIAPNFYNDVFNMLNPINIVPADRTILATPGADFYHTKFDYRCVPINFERVDGTNNSVAPYLIDFRKTSTYKGPEPLETFMQGVRESIKKIKDRNLRGDSISIVGFDWDAEIKARRQLGSDPTIGINPISTASEFTDLENLFKDPFDSATPNARFPKLKDFYNKTAFIPRIQNRYLSIPHAINEAYSILKTKSNFATADNMIILLTTGLTNCRRNADTTQTCGQDTADFNQSINDTITFAEDTLKKQGIILHTLLRSPRVQPASKVVPGCKIEDDTQGFDYSNQYNFTHPEAAQPLEKQTGTFDSGVLNFNGPFRLPNNLAKANMATGGVWAPVRPPCPGTSPNAIKANFNNKLIDYCKTTKVISDPKVIDANGNIVCDPNGLTPAQQTTNYIEKMFDVTPLIPVSEGVIVN